MSAKRFYPVRLYVAGAIVILLAGSGCSRLNRQFVTSARAARSPFATRRTTGDQHDEESAERLGPRGQSESWGAEAGNRGAYVSGGATATGNPVVMGATGGFYMPHEFLTTRYGFVGADDSGIGAGGIEAGFRAHTTNRFSPYVGLSGVAAFSSLHTGYPRRYQIAGQPRRALTVASGILAAGPEAGVSYWINPSTRLNAGATYYMTGSQPFFLVYGLTLDFVLGSPPPPRDDNPSRPGDMSQEDQQDASPTEDVRDILSKRAKIAQQE